MIEPSQYRLLFVSDESEQLPDVVATLASIPAFEVTTVRESDDGSVDKDTDSVDCVLVSGAFDDEAIRDTVERSRNRWAGTPVVLVVTGPQARAVSEKSLSAVDDCLHEAVAETDPSVLKQQIVSRIDNTRTQAELQRNRELLRRTQELGNIGGWEYDIDEDELRWTEQVYDIHELPRDYEPSVDNALAFYHEKDQSEIREKLEALLQTGESFSLEVRIVTAKGNVRWVRVRGDAEMSDGRVQRARGAIQDVTGLVEQQTESAKLRDNLQEEQDRLERLANVLAHELRNPLTAVHGQLQLYRELGEETHLDAVERNVERLDEIIDDTLWLVQEDDTVTEMTMVDVPSVASDAWRTVNDETVTLHTESMERIPANESLLQTVFAKLFENTCAHASASRLEVGPLYMGDYLDGFYVADDGDGFDTASTDDLFDVGVKGPSGNSGIGLSVVEEIVRRHDWSISATESEDGGARFEIQTGLL